MVDERNSRLLLAGDGLSAFGAWIDFLAILTLAAYQFQVTPYQMAIVSAAGLLPGILAAPFIGRLCDRGDAKRLLQWSIAGRLVVTGAILLCRDPLVFIALVGLRSLLATVAPPAINVLAVRSVAADARPRFYAMLNVLNNAAKVLAPAIGTVSSSVASEGAALAISMVLSATAIAVFSFIRVAPSSGSNAAPGSIRSPRFALVRRMKPLLWIVATHAFMVFSVNNLFPVVLAQADFDKALLGVLVGCSGAGNLLSGLWLAKRSPAWRGDVGELIRPVVWQAVGLGAIGVLLSMASDPAVWVLPALFFTIGLFSARYAIALNVHLSTHHAVDIGGASSVLQACQNTMILAAPMVGAMVLSTFGPPWLFALGTGSALLSFAAFGAMRRQTAVNPQV